NKENVTGMCSAEFDFKGLLNDLKSVKGKGVLNVKEGDVYKIPIFGAFSEVLNSILPDMGYAKASDARGEFSFSNGVITIDQMDISSFAFAVIGHGTYDYVRDDADLSMRVNVKGIFGVPLFFVSKLFEYQGRGKLGAIKWESKVF
ncbi:MAG: hypothetical protein V1746_04555, partial [bacterium]